MAGDDTKKVEPENTDSTQGVTGSTMKAAVGTPEGDNSTFSPTAVLLGDTGQWEGESRVDYLNRLSRGSSMDRAF